MTKVGQRDSSATHVVKSGQRIERSGGQVRSVGQLSMLVTHCIRVGHMT